MTPDQHRHEAERLLNEAEKLRRNGDSVDYRKRTDKGVAGIKADLLARAQVHAALSQGRAADIAHRRADAVDFLQRVQQDRKNR